MIKLHSRRNGHSFISNKRNRVVVSVKTNENTYKLEIENVNVDNFRPCNVIMKLGNKRNINYYSGAVICDGFWDIDNLYSK